MPLYFSILARRTAYKLVRAFIQNSYQLQAISYLIQIHSYISQK